MPHWRDRGWVFAVRICIVAFNALMLLYMCLPALSDSAWWPVQITLGALAITGALLLVLPRKMTLVPTVIGILLVYWTLAAFENVRLTGYTDIVLGRYKEEWSIAKHPYKSKIRLGSMASHFTEITGKPLPEPEWRMTWWHGAGALADGPSSMSPDFEKVWESYEKSCAPLDIKKRVIEAAAEIIAFKEGPQQKISPYAKRLYLKELKQYLESFDASGRTALPFPDPRAFMEKRRKEAGKQ
jgi:hypothetical protein